MSGRTSIEGLDKEGGRMESYDIKVFRVGTREGIYNRIKLITDVKCQFRKDMSYDCVTVFLHRFVTSNTVRYLCDFTI